MVVGRGVGRGGRSEEHEVAERGEEVLGAVKGDGAAHLPEEQRTSNTRACKRADAA